MQKFSSANTSINSAKLPRIYSLVSKEIKPGDKVIDYGCGKFFDRYILGFDCVGYDPYNKPDAELTNKSYDIALCSNVLNVIAEPEERLNLLRKLKELASVTFITVYEGDKSGVGRVTKADCYQTNKQRGEYIPELVAVFGYGNVKYHRSGYFECRRGVA